MMTANDVRKGLRSIANPEIAEHSKRFFKTGQGEYGQGDCFLGIKVPDQRKIARKHGELTLNEIEKLLQSGFHEERLTAIFILEHKYRKASRQEQSEIYHTYISNLEYVNNWDLVDSSAPKISGVYLEDKPRDILYELAESNNLWKRRVSIMTTLHFIRNGDYKDTLAIADVLLYDKHDLIHKATGWMLREIGKKDRELLENFLKPRYQKMPRTMLRYAIEKLPESKRQAYLKGSIH